MTHTFTCETAEVKVTPTMQALGDQPWQVQVIPSSPLLPVETIIVEEQYPFLAAAEALDRYKNKHGLPLSEVWNKEDGR